MTRRVRFTNGASAPTPRAVRIVAAAGLAFFGFFCCLMSETAAEAAPQFRHEEPVLFLALMLFATAAWSLASSAYLFFREAE